MVTLSALLADSRTWFTLFIAAVALQRLSEVALSRRNARRMLAHHGVELGRGHLPLMVALHVAFLAACPLEVWIFDRPTSWWLALPLLTLVGVTQALRYWAIHALGDRWSIRVIVVPGTVPVVRGPYRWIRHPNYLAVVVEIAAIPLVHGAWATALLFSVLNGLLLARRISVEESLLRQVGSYKGALDALPRFIPRPDRRPRG